MRHLNKNEKMGNIFECEVPARCFTLDFVPFPSLYFISLSFIIRSLNFIYNVIAKHRETWV